MDKKMKNRYGKEGCQTDSFMEKLHSLDNMSKKSKAVLTKEKVAAYFKDVNLSEQQQELIFAYLQRPGEESSDPMLYESTDDRLVSLTADKEAGDNTELPDSAFFEMYLEHLQKITPCTHAEEDKLYDRLAAGDETAVQKLSEQWMLKVPDIARTQILSADQTEMADMVQEGNMAVFLALKQLLGSGKKTEPEKELFKAVRDAMEQYLQKITADAHMDQSLLAKAALVYEAQKYLAEQLQRLPSAAELSQYTKLPETELEDILAILEEKK